SDEECSTSESEDEEYAMAVRDFKKFFKRIECPNPPKDKNQRAFVGGSWSNSGEEDDEKAKVDTCLVAQASNESKNNHKEQKIKRLKAVRNSLENELRIETEKLKEEAITLSKFEKSTHCLNEMLNNQKPSRDKLGLGFNSLESSTSETKEIKFVKSQKETSPGGGPLNKGGPHIAEVAPKAIIGPPVCSPDTATKKERWSTKPTLWFSRNLEQFPPSKLHAMGNVSSISKS
ncbi:hypothetical protein Tco_1582023, partial [Tanacetum coccineum]